MVLVFPWLMRFRNGLKSKLKETVKIYFRNTKRGAPVKPVKEIGTVKKNETGNKSNIQTGMMKFLKLLNLNLILSQRECESLLILIKTLQ